MRTKLTIRPLTAECWPDFEAIFNARGCAIARGCWCMYYRETGRQAVPPGRTLAEVRKARMRKLATAEPPVGLLAYGDGHPVGWVAVAPRTDYVKLQRSPVMKPVDDAPVWSVLCFVVPAEHRGRGVATALLDAAVAHARRHGARIVEAYPFDREERGRDEWLWHGVKSMYDRAGFVEVARRKPQRPIVRLALAKRRG